MSGGPGGELCFQLSPRAEAGAEGIGEYREHKHRGAGQARCAREVGDPAGTDHGQIGHQRHVVANVVVGGQRYRHPGDERPHQELQPRTAGSSWRTTTRIVQMLPTTASTNNHEEQLRVERAPEVPEEIGEGQRRRLVARDCAGFGAGQLCDRGELREMVDIPRRSDHERDRREQTPVHASAAIHRERGRQGLIPTTKNGNCTLTSRPNRPPGRQSAHADTTEVLLASKQPHRDGDEGCLRARRA